MSSLYNVIIVNEFQVVKNFNIDNFTKVKSKDR